MMSKLMGAVVLALAVTGCGGPLEEETMDAQSQQQQLMTPGDVIQVEGKDAKLIMRDQDAIRKFARPDQQDRLFYKVNAGSGDCVGGH